MGDVDLIGPLMDSMIVPPHLVKKSTNLPVYIASLAVPLIAYILFIILW